LQKGTIKAQIMKSFESWTFEDVELTFSIKRIENHPLLMAWISTPCEISEIEKNIIKHHSNRLRRSVEAWNEDELKMLFIGPLISVVDFDTEKYKAFTQRSLTLKTDKEEASGLVDLMIATGKARPREPFFFLHEYKPHHPSKKNDPLGQLLIAMVAAQTKNTIPHSVYGVLVEGRFWYFVVLHNNEYSVSNAYNATDNNVFQIYAILCKVKDYIEEILAQSIVK